MKPGPPRHKQYGAPARPTTPRTPKHRLSVDANLQIPDVLNSASKKDLLRRVCQNTVHTDLEVQWTLGGKKGFKGALFINRQIFFRIGWCHLIFTADKIITLIIYIFVFFEEKLKGKYYQ